jgi:hypothetical protein
MKPRKSKDLKSVLQQKGFVLHPDKKDHQFFVLYVGGRKQHISTFLSHGIKEYGNSLMAQMKKQLRFKDTQKAEDFFDCPLTREGYIQMLHENDEI